LSATPHRVFLFHRDGRYVYANRQGARLHGLTQREFVGKAWRDLGFPEEIMQPVEKRWFAVFGSGQSLREEVEFPTQEGVRCFHHIFSPVCDATGVVKYVVAIVRDVTELKAAEKLKQENRELEQFAYVASHDLQEPLRMVASYTQLLARRYRGQLDADADEFIDFAVDGATRMRALINDLLEYARLGTKRHQAERVDCEKVVERALVNLSAAIEERGARVTHDPLPAVRGDESQLVRLFQNVLGNAIKLSRADNAAVHVGAVPHDSSVRFAVRDNGIGIEARHFDRVFQVFQRLHSREEYPGNGIGLAVCKKVVETHGGRMWLESEPGAGTTFFFTLPAAESSSPVG